MDIYTLIFLALVIGAAIFFVCYSKRLGNKIQEQTDKELQQKLLEDAAINNLRKDIGDFRSYVTESFGKIEEAQNNVKDLGSAVNELKTVLRGNQTRGRYGEMQLKMLLENTFSNTKGIYAEQYAIKGESVRPDAVIFLPEPEKLLCIDSKFPFAEYQELFKEDVTEERKNSLKTAFRAAVKSHITTIKNKYIIEGETSPYAVMFLPNDGIFYYIHVELYDLAEYARSVGVILSSPGTLQPILATISSFWREYRRNENLQEISKQIKDLKTAFKVFGDSWGPFSNSFDQAYERKVKVQEELARLQTKLDKIVKAETEE